MSPDFVLVRLQRSVHTYLKSFVVTSNRAQETDTTNVKTQDNASRSSIDTAVCKPKCGGNGGAKNVQGITTPTIIYLNVAGLKHNVNILTRRPAMASLHREEFEGSNLTLILRRGDPQYKGCKKQGKIRSIIFQDLVVARLEKALRDGKKVRCMVDLVSVTMSVAGIVFGVAAKFIPLENGDFPKFC
ncbi:hypothetical protein Bbelb_280730 [Branchiostoma belcheri]|nr:hypothetical protein Bbelb_280730 [Branchiostoma belcheri]